MAEDKKKPSNLQKMKDAIKNKPQSTMKVMDDHAAAKKTGVAAAVTPKKPKKNHRSAKARDERAKSRGRLPINTKWIPEWDGKKISGCMFIRTVPPGLENYKGGDIVNDHEYMEATVPDIVKVFTHESDGLFRLMEELDIMFWEWLANEATADQKAQLTFAPHPPEPAPWPNPETPEDKAPVPPA